MPARARRTDSGPAARAVAPPAGSADTIRRLRRSELPVDTVDLAIWLLGKTLVRETPRCRMAGRIVETEAYVVGDASCHAFRGQTPRTRSLFLERGHAYVYLIYGSHYCLNVSGERAGIGTAVLLRALEPLQGVEEMRRNRRAARRRVPGREAPVERSLTSGPGRLAAALEVDRSLDGLDLCAPGPLWLGTPARRTGPIGRSVRIGLSIETDRVLRFYERDNPWVSGPKRMRQ